MKWPHSAVFAACVVVVVLAPLGGLRAQTLKDKILLPVQESVWDRTNKVRANNAIILIDGGTATFSYEAASAAKECNFGGTRSSWMEIALMKGSRQLGGFKRVDVASVHDRGGYEAHDKIVTPLFGVGFWNAADRFAMRLPGMAKC